MFQFLFSDPSRLQSSLTPARLLGPKLFQTQSWQERGSSISLFNLHAHSDPVRHVCKSTFLPEPRIQMDCESLISPARSQASISITECRERCHRRSGSFACAPDGSSKDFLVNSNGFSFYHCWRRRHLRLFKCGRSTEDEKTELCNASPYPVSPPEKILNILFQSLLQSYSI